MNEELIAKAKEAKSAEELLALAKENGYSLTEEEAQNYFNQFHDTCEFSDDELDQVGGGCGKKDEYTDAGYWIIPDRYSTTCENYNKFDIWSFTAKDGVCDSCRNRSYDAISDKPYCVLKPKSVK